MKTMTHKTKEQTNREIKKVFKRNHIKPLPGLEGFWNAVDDVYDVNRADGDYLTALGDHWDTVPSQKQLR